MRLLTSFIIAVLLVGGALADSLNVSSRTIASSNWKQGDAAYWLGGEHNYIQWKGTAALAGTADPDTTVWIQYSPVYGIPDSTSFDKAHLYPRTFTLDVAVASAGDSVGLKGIRVEYAWQNTTAAWMPSTTKPILNADSTYALVSNGNINRIDYSTWTFEDWPESDSASGYARYCWRYPIKVEAPGYVRFIFTSASNLSDAQTLTWILTGVY